MTDTATTPYERLMDRLEQIQMIAGAAVLDAHELNQPDVTVPPPPATDDPDPDDRPTPDPDEPTDDPLLYDSLNLTADILSRLSNPRLLHPKS